MTDGIDLSALISALGGGSGDLAAKLSSALGGDGVSKLTDALSGGDAASKLTDALGSGDLSTKLTDALTGAGLASLLFPSGADAPNGDDERAKSSPQSGSALPSVVAALTRGGDERSKQRRELLTAIRPFVSERRKRAIDALVGIEKLTAVLPGVK